MVSSCVSCKQGKVGHRMAPLFPGSDDFSLDRICPSRDDDDDDFANRARRKQTINRVGIGTCLWSIRGNEPRSETSLRVNSGREVGHVTRTRRFQLTAIESTITDRLNSRARTTRPKADRKRRWGRTANNPWRKTLYPVYKAYENRTFTTQKVHSGFIYIVYS